MNPRSVRILVVDDISLMRHLTSTYLKTLLRPVFQPVLGPVELEIFEATDGVVATTMLAEQSPVDLIFLDLMMPRKDGLTFLTEVRADPAYDATKVVILTAVDEPAVMERVLAAGANALLRKPFTLKSLRGTLEELLRETVES